MIKTSALQFAYPGAAPLHFPDVDVPQGATLLLRGPSGSGKSTWLALVAALVPPTVGSLEVAGQNLTALSRVQADAWRARTLGGLGLALVALLTWWSCQAFIPTLAMPILEKSRSAITPLDNPPITATPASVRNTIRAVIACKANADPTTRRLILRRPEDSAKAMARMAKTPTRLSRVDVILPFTAADALLL